MAATPIYDKTKYVSIISLLLWRSGKGFRSSSSKLYTYFKNDEANLLRSTVFFIHLINWYCHVSACLSWLCPSLLMQIQQIMALLLRCRQSRCLLSWPMSLIHSTSHNLHTMRTHVLWSTVTDGGWLEEAQSGGTCSM